jgi:hypothetical protein
MPKSPVKEKGLGNRIESEKTLSNGQFSRDYAAALATSVKN